MADESSDYLFVHSDEAITNLSAEGLATSAYLLNATSPSSSSRSGAPSASNRTA